MAASRGEILKLYKTLLREGEKFTSYNFRMYTLRKTKDSFRENKMLTSAEEVSQAINEARTSLEVIRRQALISSMYQTDKLVVEKT